MKIRVMVLSCVTGAVILSTGYIGTEAGLVAFGKSEPAKAVSGNDKVCPKIGVVSIREVFRVSVRISRYRQEAMVERQTMEVRLNGLAKEIQSEESGLSLLSPGSSDHLAQLERIYKKRANYEMEKELYNKKLALKEQRITEDLYGAILLATRAVAAEKGLDLVFEKSEPELPAPSPTQFELAMATHKLLYSGGCLDISKDVLARIDSEDRAKAEAASKNP
ncbi:MAG: OmpH/Skp family outer membrane protein [Planctomycetota bacterium]|jgi:Skp family chaperone for outer membrane proteins